MCSKAGIPRTADETSTPVFPWSPLPPRKKLNYVEPTEERKSNGNSYPNIDFSVYTRSCEQEIIQPAEGQVIGEIPIWLKGSLVRNGPGLLKIGKDSFQHLLDCSALLHRFEINEGKIKYQSRFLQSETFKQNMKANGIITTEFGTKAVPDPCHSIFKRVAAVFTSREGLSDNSLVSVYPFGDDLYAFTEIPIIHKINKNTLNVDDTIDLHKTVGFITHTAHPHVTFDGTVFNIGMKTNMKGLYHNIVSFPNSNTTQNMFDNARIVAKIPSRWPLHPSYMHTFGLTDNYFIIVEQPLSLSLPSLVKGKLKNEPVIGSLKWYSNEMVQINVISRKTGKRLKKFFSETFFFFHIINQYEKDDYIVVDICAYRDAAAISGMYVEAMQNMQSNLDYAKMFRGRPLRFIIPMRGNLSEEIITFPNSKAKAKVSKNGTVILEPETICDLTCELPRIHYQRYLGKEYRYFYAISADVDAKNPGSLIKVDTKEKTCVTWCEDNSYPSEPIFVPRPNSKDEDDGILLSALVWASPDTNHVSLLILDAKTFMEIARAEFSTPGPVPKCLHGWFLGAGNA